MALILAAAEGASPATSETTTGTEQPQHSEGHSFPPFDASLFPSQLLWLAITFVALYLVLGRVVIPRIGGILKDRAGRIARDLENAEKARAASEAALAGYEKALASARTNAGAIAEAARTEAKAKAEAERRATEDQLAHKLAEAEGRIADIKSRALSDVGTIASDTAAAIVKALVGADVGKPEADAAVAAIQGK
jgi:F-type H+-transporting ATPase subunit b